MRRWRWQWWIPALAAVALTALSGCGDDGGGSGAGDEQGAPGTETSTTTASPAPSVEIVEPADEAKGLTSPVKVRMEVQGFTVEPAGEVRPGAGHLHVVVDGDCVAPGTVISSDPTHIHLGKAQMETEVTLTPGLHSLCAQIGDGAHTALDIKDVIEIEVSG
jgi:hypothetical protein